jgi:hypothetical protein
MEIYFFNLRFGFVLPIATSANVWVLARYVAISLRKTEEYSSFPLPPKQLQPIGPSPD